MSTLHRFTVLLVILLLACGQDTATHVNELDTQVPADDGVSVVDGGMQVLGDVGGSTNSDLGVSDVGSERR